MYTFVEHDQKDELAEYLLRWHLSRDANGHEEVFSADWQSYPSRLAPPFSSYSENAIESFWKVHDNAASSLPTSPDILAEIQRIEKILMMWLEDDRFRNLKAEINRDQLAPRRLLRGSNKLSTDELEPDDGGAKNRTRLTLNGILDFAKGDYYVEQWFGKRHVVACPKYDPERFDDAKLRAWLRLVADDAPMQEDDLRTLEIIVGSGVNEVIHFTKVLSWARHYTVLEYSNDQLCEYHQDFAIEGRTEHSVWYEEVFHPQPITRSALRRGNPKRRAQPKLNVKEKKPMKEKKPAQATTRAKDYTPGAANGVAKTGRRQMGILEPTHAPVSSSPSRPATPIYPPTLAEGRPWISFLVCLAVSATRVYFSSGCFHHKSSSVRLRLHSYSPTRKIEDIVSTSMHLHIVAAIILNFYICINHIRELHV
jgi:hypothetical protein